MPKKHTIRSFIEKAKHIHQSKYGYDEVIYRNNKTKINIICFKHGVFKQRPDDHLKGVGCKFCYYDRRRKDCEIFIDEANIVHNNKYDYTKFKYNQNRNVKGIIICEKHGEFKQEPNAHLKGSGCPTCKESQGEMKIGLFLIKNNLIFEKEKFFKNCKNERYLIFDFYLPEYNLLIEYDGDQHFKAKKFFGGEKTLKRIKENDEIKNNYSKENNIDLCRINYLEFNNIENILSKRLKLI